MGQLKTIFLLCLIAIGFSSLTCAEEDNDRIVGGDEVDANSVPWQVGLLYKKEKSPFCGGTIVSATKILTAAHCIYTSAKNLKVIVGEHDILDHQDKAVIHNVTSAVKHPNYNPRNVNNDFAVLTLKEPIVLSDFAKAACLPTKKEKLKEGDKLIVSGWGTLNSGDDDGPNVLHAVAVPYVSNKKCKKAYGRNGPITRNMMCAGDVKNGGIDSCQGDSGGPLTKFDSASGKTKVVGVVSWGIGCGWEGYPGVYARVNKQLTWLKSHGVIDTCTST